jgi:hypothetical protein
MSQGLKKATGSGMSASKISLSAAQKALLTEGDIEGLLELHHSQFGPARMEDDEDDDEDDEDDEDESDEDDDAEGDDDEDDEDEESGDDKAKAKSKAKLDPKDERIKSLTAEAKKYRLKNRDHRSRIAELERELAEARRGKSTRKAKAKDDDDTDEDDRPQGDAELEQKYERAQRALEDAAIRTEFLSDTTFKWKNPKAALRLLDLRDVEVDEDGDVLGLEEAIEKLAKDEPYLLAEQEEARPRTKRRQPVGQPSGTKRKGNANRAKLIDKYPALRR